MFGNSKKQTAASRAQVGTIIGKDTFFKGSINSQEIIRIDGNFEGDITTTADVIIGEESKIRAQIEAKNITVGGFVEGNLIASGRLELFSTAKLYGDVMVESFVVNEGSIFRGSCTMKNEDNVRDDTNNG